MAKAQKKEEQALRSIKARAVATAKDAKKASSAPAKRGKHAEKSAKVITALVAKGDGERPEPPFRYEVHVKKALCIVDVTLHKVPPQTIDIAQTTRTRLVVDCAKHTKPYLLAFDMPYGMTVDPETAEYTYENGILHCVLKSDTGAVPAEAKQEREAFIGKVTAGKELRFRMSKEGQVVVRSRKAHLTLQPAATTAAPAPTAAASTDAPKSKGRAATAPEPVAADNGKYVSDSGMADIAAAVGSATKAAINNKVRVLHQKEKSEQRREALRDTKKAARQAKESGAFKRVIEDQRRLLAARVAASQPKARSDSSKRVSFQ